MAVVPLQSSAAPRRTFDDLVEHSEEGMIILASARHRLDRRILFINSYGGPPVWEQIKRGLLPPHHLWGCIELARMGYEVALAAPLAHFDYRRPLLHDLPLLGPVRRWLRRDDIIYCGHTLLYWIPVLKALRAIKCPIVSLTYAREHLDFSGLHTGIIALTGAAADEARKRAPKAKLAHLSWGCDLGYYPTLKYRPEWFLSCGITHRDFPTLASATARVTHPVRLICPGAPAGTNWSPNVSVIDGGSGWNFQKTVVRHDELIHDHYAGTIASLIILKADPAEKTAVGFTNLLESMAMGRPVIATRTGALPSEIDVEATGCGLHIPAEDPSALVQAINSLAAAPDAARAMGIAGRRLAEKHYNMQRYGNELHAFFASF